MTTPPAPPRSHGQQLAAIYGEMMSLSKQMTVVSQDAREGRDGMRELKASLDAQKLGDRLASLERRLAEHPETVRTIVKTALREAQDDTDERFLRIEADVAGQGTRISRLETVHTRRKGAEGLVGAFLRHIPVILSACAAAFAAIVAWLSGRHPPH